MSTLEHKSFETPDEQRTPPKAVIDIVNVGGQTFARATFRPGWRWSVDVKPVAGTDSCQFTHVGTVLEGRIAVRLDDGTEDEYGVGDVFTIPPGHDGWVVGDEPYIRLEISQPTVAGFAKARVGGPAAPYVPPARYTPAAAATPLPGSTAMPASAIAISAPARAPRTINSFRSPMCPMRKSLPATLPRPPPSERL
jgi:hypothetical protein